MHSPRLAYRLPISTRRSKDSKPRYRAESILIYHHLPSIPPLCFVSCTTTPSFTTSLFYLFIPFSYWFVQLNIGFTSFLDFSFPSSLLLPPSLVPVVYAKLTTWLARAFRLNETKKEVISVVLTEFWAPYCVASVIVLCVINIYSSPLVVEYRDICTTFMNTILEYYALFCPPNTTQLLKATQIFVLRYWTLSLLTLAARWFVLIGKFREEFKNQILLSFSVPSST